MSKAPGQATCAVIHTGETYEGKQGLECFSGISAQSAGPGWDGGH